MDIQKITTHDLAPGDIIIVTVDTSHMPPTRASQYIDKIRREIKGVIGTDYKVIAKPATIQLEIIRTPVDDRDDVETRDCVDSFERAKPIG